jgi:glucokinase
MAGPYSIGVDIGGTKIAAGLMDGAGQLQHRSHAATPSGGGAAVLSVAIALIEELRSKVDDGDVVVAIGVGAPGVVDPVTGVVLSATQVLPGWAGTAVRADLESATGLPVAVDNDVRAMAFGEANAGAGKGLSRLLQVSVGTGIGGALTRDGRLERGNHGTTGEIAHLLVPAVGAITCGCGRSDHVEAIASGPAIAASYAARVATSSEGVAGIAAAPSESIALPEVVARAIAGDSDAQFVLQYAATMLGRALAGLVSALDVDAVIVGGGVLGIGAQFSTPLSDAFRAEVLPPLRDVPVLTAQLGVDAPLIGAAMLSIHQGADQ